MKNVSPYFFWELNVATKLYGFKIYEIQKVHNKMKQMHFEQNKTNERQK